MTSTDIDVAIDLSIARDGAERARNCLLGLRARHDLSPFEYCREVRIAPLARPHSHPVITLNALVINDLSYLCLYLHEQAHWLTAWYAQARRERWDRIGQALQTRYPDVPVGGSEGAGDADSSYLHLVVNWLEIEFASRLVGTEAARNAAGAIPYYRALYAIVLKDWGALETLYTVEGLLPARPANEMNDQDRALAAAADWRAWP